MTAIFCCCAAANSGSQSPPWKKNSSFMALFDVFSCRLSVMVSGENKLFGTNKVPSSSGRRRPGGTVFASRGCSLVCSTMGDGFCCAGAAKQAANKENRAIERRILEVFKGTPAIEAALPGYKGFWNKPRKRVAYTWPPGMDRPFPALG